MAKLLVETRGDYQLVDFESNTLAQAHRPSVVPAGGFFDAEIQNRRLTLLAELADTATDEDWVETLEASGEVTLAIEAFKSMHALVIVKKTEPVKTAPASRRGSRVS